MSTKVDRDMFKAKFPKAALFGKTLTPGRKQGFDAVFDAWDPLGNGGPINGLAYALATAWHETGGVMQPVREGFETTDAAAVAHVTEYCKAAGIPNYAARQPNGHSYYGRGYVQLTHAANYKTMGRLLGVGDALFDDPDRVMDPKVAASILLTGMMKGTFRPTKGKLADYFGPRTNRWVEARDLINGDKSKKPKWADGKSIGQLISGYAKGFSGALRYA